MAEPKKVVKVGAGKGSVQRRVDEDRYTQNYNNIKWEVEHDEESKETHVCNGRDREACCGGCNSSVRSDNSSADGCQGSTV